MPTRSLIEQIAMNIVYQLDDDAGLSVVFRQANNDKRINFVKGLLDKEFVSKAELKEILDGAENEFEDDDPTNFVPAPIKAMYRQGYLKALTDIKNLDILK